MLNAERREAVLTSVMEDFTKRLANTKKTLDAIAKVEAEGIECLKSDYIPYSIDITREQLPALRRAVGRLQVSGKDLSWDFDTTGEIYVSIRPMAKEFEGLLFRYRTVLRGQKCHVEERTYTNKSLVCKI